MRLVTALVCGLMILAGCGADGPPVRPQPKPEETSSVQMPAPAEAIALRGDAMRLMRTS